MENSIILTEQEMAQLEPEMESFHAGDSVVLGFAFSEEPDVSDTSKAHALGLWVNGECYNCWTFWHELPVNIQQRFQS